MTPERQSKPFPWRCPKCLAREVRPKSVEYRAQVKHDGRLHKIVVPQLSLPVCDACGEQVFSNDTDAQISRALRGNLRLLQPDEIRSQREGLGLTQKILANHLGVAAETICRWESGALIQSRAMDTLLRIYFGFPDVRAAQQAASMHTAGAGAEVGEDDA